MSPTLVVHHPYQTKLRDSVQQQAETTLKSEAVSVQCRTQADVGGRQFCYPSVSYQTVLVLHVSVASSDHWCWESATFDTQRGLTQESLSVGTQVNTILTEFPPSACTEVGQLT